MQKVPGAIHIEWYLALYILDKGQCIIKINTVHLPLMRTTKRYL
jgi:hypothetical protein